MPRRPSRPAWPVVLLALLPAHAARADRLSLSPAEVVLRGRWDRHQLVLTGRDDQGREHDLTRRATWSVLDPAVASVAPGGAVAPLRDGHTTVVARLGRREARAAVRVEGVGGDRPVSLRLEVIPVLTRAGCNAGACHGTPTGRNGFRLSLRGYDPDLDAQALSREAHGRRVNVVAPDASLLLLKAAGRRPHGGGPVLDPQGPSYALLRQWVAEGARAEGPTPALDAIEIFPAHRILDDPEREQQFRVTARFAGGARREVTHLARFGVSAEHVAEAGAGGLVRRRQRGEVAVTAEYLGQMVAARLIFRDRDPGVAWKAPPEHNYVDRHVFAKLKLLGLTPAPLCDDATFLRRAHLDVLGKLPTPDEVRRFLAEASPGKRERRIDALLARPEFADWWALKWADRLGCNQRFVGKIGARKYFEWVRQQMAANVPEDRFVFDILTAGGGNYGHPPAGFYRRLRNPQARAEEAAQLFLGVRLGCARCHNHPGERWTQDDYHGLAAFFARVRYKDGPFFNHLYDKEETVYAVREGEAVHPRTGQVLAPRFLGGPVAAVGPHEDRRAVFARWLVGRDNPFFARAAVNRIWYHLFGQGIVDPVDDLRVTNPPSNDELLDALSVDFVRHGFDRKHLIRTVLRSRTYQFAAANPAATPSADDLRYFGQRKVRMLGAEQLLDALGSATGVPEKFPGFPAGTPAVALPDGEYRHPLLEAFGRPARAMACECERGGDTNFNQALHLAAGRTLHAMLHSDAGRAARLAAPGTADAAAVEELFLASLSRFPTRDEKEFLTEKLRKAGAGRRRVIEDFLWALVNHREFLFQH